MMPTNRGESVGSKKSSRSSSIVAEFVLPLKGFCKLCLPETQSIQRVFRLVAEVAELGNIYCVTCLSRLTVSVLIRIIYARKSGYFGYLGYLPAKICLIIKKSPQLVFPTVGRVCRVATRSATFHKGAQLLTSSYDDGDDLQLSVTSARPSVARAYRMIGEIVNGLSPAASIFLNLTGGKPLLLEGDEGE